MEYFIWKYSSKSHIDRTTYIALSLKKRFIENQEIFFSVLRLHVPYKDINGKE